jgi:hypothetical protein
MILVQLFEKLTWTRHQKWSKYMVNMCMYIYIYKYIYIYQIYTGKWNNRHKLQLRISGVQIYLYKCIDIYIYNMKIKTYELTEMCIIIYI